MRYFCPKYVKKMLVQQTRSVYCKKWAAKHENEECKDGIWLEPALALLRKKTKEDWTNIEACHKEAGTEKHRLYHCPGWYEVRREIQAFISESKKRKLRKGLEVAKKYFYASSQ